MEFVFQTGEFYNENNFLLELLQIIIPTLAAIAAALLPFRFAKCHERNKEFKNFKNLENYFYALLSNVVEKIKDQIIHIEKVIDTLEQKKFLDFRLTIVSGFLFDKFRQITNQEKIYKLFVLGKATTHNNNQNSLIRIFNAIESTETNIHSLYDHLDKFNGRYMMYQNSWNDNISKFINQLEKDVVEVGRNQMRDWATIQYVERFSSVISEWQKLGTAEISITFDQIIEPARNLSQELKHAAYLPYIKECLYAYENIKKLRLDYIATFGLIMRALQKNNQIIIEETKNLKNIPFKPASNWI